MAPRVYNDKGEKLCKGKLHIGDGSGTFLSLVRFGHYKKGNRAGKPMSLCRDCHRISQGFDPNGGWTPEAEVEPLYKRLMEFYDSNAALCNDLGLPREYFSRKREWRKTEVVIRMRELIAEIENDKTFHSKGEAEVVRSVELAPHIQKWINEYLAERPLAMNSDDGAENVFMGPFQVLSARSGITERRIRAILRQEQELVSLSHADGILTAMHMWDLISTETITVIPNPNWSMERWLDYMADRGCR